MANFDFDQEYASNFAYSVIHNHQKLLIGQGLSVQGLFMGPWYFYYLTPFFALTALHPIGGFIGSCLLSLFGIVVFFIVASKLFNEKVGLIGAALASVGFSSLNSSWSMVPSYSSEVVVLVVWYCLYRYWRSDTKLFPLMFLCFGLFTSFHPILFPFYFVFLIIFIIKRRLPKLNEGVLSLLTLLLTTFPLILFEIFHNFLEIKLLLHLEGSSSPKSLDLLLSYLKVIFNSPGQSLKIQFVSAETISILAVTALITLIMKRVSYFKDSFHPTALLTTFLVYIVYYFLYPGHVPEYYFNGLSVLFSLYFAAALGLLLKLKRGPLFLGVILLGVALSNFYLIYKRWNDPSLTTLGKKDFIVKEIIRREGSSKDFYVSYISAPGWGSGFNYLFTLYGYNSSGKYPKPPIYTIVVPKSYAPGNLDVTSGNIGLILPR